MQTTFVMYVKFTRIHTCILDSATGIKGIMGNLEGVSQQNGRVFAMKTSLSVQDVIHGVFVHVYMLLT